MKRIWWWVGILALIYVAYDFFSTKHYSTGTGCAEDDYQCQSAAHDRIYR